MVGARTSLLASALALVVAVYAPHQEQRLTLDWRDAGNGISVMRSEVTIAQWQHCVDDGACSFSPKPGLGARDDGFPVTGIGALDAQEFVAWAQKATGENVQLPTLEQWREFSEVPQRPTAKRFSDPRMAWAAGYGSEANIDPTLRPSGGFGHTSKQIADVRGNVWEWTSSCVVDVAADRCPAYFAAGEHEAKVPIFVRDPASGGCSSGTPPAHLGLRLVLASNQHI
jgi:formylglycine-generating enzyme required for sulfatase activity